MTDVRQLRPKAFVNIGYSWESEQIADAIEIALYAAGYKPVFMGDQTLREGEGEWRAILRVAKGASLFVHDLSRDTGQGVRRVPRANNAFELGLLLGAYGRTDLTTRRHLVLTRHDTPLQEMLGDLYSWSDDRVDLQRVNFATVREVLEAVWAHAVAHAGASGGASNSRNPMDALVTATTRYATARAMWAAGRRAKPRVERYRPGLTWRFVVPPSSRQNLMSAVLDEARSELAEGKAR
jgi:hypothetical protein